MFETDLLNETCTDGLKFSGFPRNKPSYQDICIYLWISSESSNYVRLIINTVPNRMEEE